MPLVPLILLGILLIFFFFYGLASGNTGHPLFKAGATLMVLLAVFIYICYKMIQNASAF